MSKGGFSTQQSREEGMGRKGMVLGPAEDQGTWVSLDSSVSPEAQARWTWVYLCLSLWVGWSGFATAEPANMVLSCFSETTDQKCKSFSQSICREKNFDFQSINNQSFPTLTPQNHKTTSWPELEHWNSFRSQGSVVQEDLALTPLYHKRTKFKGLQLKLAPPVLLHTGSPQALKTLAWSGKQDGSQTPLVLPSSQLVPSPSINLSCSKFWCFQFWPFEVSGTWAWD